MVAPVVRSPSPPPVAVSSSSSTRTELTVTTASVTSGAAVQTTSATSNRVHRVTLGDVLGLPRSPSAVVILDRRFCRRMLGFHVRPPSSETTVCSRLLTLTARAADHRPGSSPRPCPSPGSRRRPHVPAAPCPPKPVGCSVTVSVSSSSACVSSGVSTVNVFTDLELLHRRRWLLPPPFAPGSSRLPPAERDRRRAGTTRYHRHHRRVSSLHRHGRGRRF